MPSIDLFKDPKGAMAKLRALLGQQFEDAVRRAAEIVEEEYKRFAQEAAGAGQTGIFASMTTQKTEKRKGGILSEISVFVPKSGGGGNLVFHVLNEGTPPLGAAASHGLKAWPIHYPRDPAFGNSPMTVAGSPALNPAFSNEPLIFRPVINNGIEPRNFTDDILDRSQRRIDAEGLGGFVSVKTSEQN